MKKPVNTFYRLFNGKLSEANFKQQIRQIQYKINNRTRANLNFYSPKEIFYLYLQNN
jgi:IS30 family transposase